MMASMACFTLNDAIIKLVGVTLPLPQLLMIRGGIASVLIFGLALAVGGLTLQLGRRGWTLLGWRCVTEILAAYFFLTALMNMPLANVTAVLQALPLVVSLGAWIFFGDRIGWRRMMAIIVGFCGVMLIVRPGMEGFSVWSVYALIAVLSVTARDLVTRRMPSHVPSLTVTLATSVTVAVVFGGVSLGQPWAPLNGWLLTCMVASSVLIVGAYFFSVQVMRVGEVSFIAPFRYTSLLWALMLGFVVFGHWPDSQTLLGAGIVVGAGIFTLWRERHVREADPKVFD